MTRLLLTMSAAAEALAISRSKLYVEHPGFRAHLVLCEQLSRVGCCWGEVTGPELMLPGECGLTWGGGP